MHPKNLDHRQPCPLFLSRSNQRASSDDLRNSSDRSGKTRMRSERKNSKKQKGQRARKYILKCIKQVEFSRCGSIFFRWLRLALGRHLSVVRRNLSIPWRNSFRDFAERTFRCTFPDIISEREPERRSNWSLIALSLALEAQRNDTHFDDRRRRNDMTIARRFWGVYVIGEEDPKRNHSTRSFWAINFQVLPRAAIY